MTSPRKPENNDVLHSSDPSLLAPSRESAVLDRRPLSLEVATSTCDHARTASDSRADACRRGVSYPVTPIRLLGRVYPQAVIGRGGCFS